MGLDNFPHRYPCTTSGTAVLDGDGRVDCVATGEAGGCPWRERFTVERPGTPSYGTLGTFCWWRGKVSQHHLEMLADDGYHLPEALTSGLYGVDTDEGPELDPDYCQSLADWLAEHAEAFAAALHSRGHHSRDEIDTYRYAIWWLRFVATEAGGANSWW